MSKKPIQGELLASVESRYGNNLVVQDNRLIAASQSMTLGEKRLLMMAASQLDSRNPMPESNTIKIAAHDFAVLFGLQGGSAYTHIAKAAEMLYHRSIKSIVKTGEGKSSTVEREVRWVWMCEYSKEDSSVVLGFSPYLSPYLTELNRQFTKYRLSAVAKLGTFYSIRIYECCVQYLHLGSREVPLEEFRSWLDLGDKYPTFKDFKKWVLQPSVTEINESTDVVLDVEPVKRGRSVVALLITVQEKSKSGWAAESDDTMQGPKEAVPAAKKRAPRKPKTAPADA